MANVLLVVAEGTDIADNITITVGDIIKAEARAVVGDGAEVGTILEAFTAVAVTFADIAVAKVIEAEVSDAATVKSVVAIAVVIEAEVVVSAVLADISEVGG